MPVSDWADLMPASVTYKPCTGRNEFGIPSFGTSVVYRARLINKNTRVHSRVTGDDVLATITLWLDGVINSLNIDSQFVMPDGRTPDILNWETVPDENGPHHTKVYFK